MPIPLPNYSLVPQIKAEYNHLYNKHRVVVIPVLPVVQDTVGGQKQSYGVPYTLVCNVQLTRLEGHDDPSRFVAGTGTIYTRVLRPKQLQQYDLFEHDGAQYRIMGVELLRDNVKFKPHHIEATFVQVKTPVKRAPIP